MALITTPEGRAAVFAQRADYDIVVTNAGAAKSGGFFTLTDADWHDGFALKFFGHLRLLPAAVADLLRAFPFDFLYGNIAADTSIAKKYAPVGRHCHAWHVGREIYELAHTEALRAYMKSLDYVDRKSTRLNSSHT